MSYSYAAPLLGDVVENLALLDWCVFAATSIAWFIPPLTFCVLLVLLTFSELGVCHQRQSTTEPMWTNIQCMILGMGPPFEAWLTIGPTNLQMAGRVR